MAEDYLEGNRDGCIGVLQRNRTQKKYNRYKEIYYMELTHTIMEAEKSRPRRDDGIVPVRV